MHERTMTAVAVTAACLIVGHVSADFTDTSVVFMGEIIDGTATYRIFANFDSPDDKLLAISASAAPLRYSGALLVQNAPGFEELQVQDVPFAASGPGDSYVTIGDNGDTTFSPGFLNPAFPGASVINGSFFEQLENGGYFDFNPGTPENGGSVLIAQFTIALGAAATYEGTVDWQPAEGGLFASTFSVIPLPGPSAAALLGLAGLAAGRRRRS